MNSCDVSYRELVERALADAIDQTHVASCPRCTENLASIEAELHATRSRRIPALSPAEVERSVERSLEAVERRQLNEGMAFRHYAMRLAAVAGVLIIGLAVWLAWSPRSTDWFTEGLVLVDGRPSRAGSPLPSEVPFEAIEPAVLTLADGSTIQLAAGARAMFKRAGEHLWLERGRLVLSVRPRFNHPLMIETTEALATVVGTRFSVTRALEPAPHTQVNVDEGVVEVRTRGDVARIGAGGSWGSLGAPSANQPDVHEVPTETVGPQPSPGTSKVTPSPGSRTVRKTLTSVTRSAAIRQKLQTGQVAEARALLINAAVVPSSSHEEDAELAILEAETRLQEGRWGHAFEAYLDVVSRFPASRQSEEALFAAAQLSLDHRSKRETATLLKRYLREYPTGRFVTEATALLQTIQGDR